MSRIKARECCFKIIFSNLFNDYNTLRESTKIDYNKFVNIEELYIENDILDNEDKNYCEDLVKNIFSNLPTIVKLIEDNVEKYKLERIYKCDLAILILAVGEMKYVPNSVLKIVVNEAVELSKQYSDVKGYRFVNAILAKIFNGVDYE